MNDQPAAPDEAGSIQSTSREPGEDPQPRPRWYRRCGGIVALASLGTGLLGLVLGYCQGRDVARYASQDESRDAATHDGLRTIDVGLTSLAARLLARAELDHIDGLDGLPEVPGWEGLTDPEREQYRTVLDLTAEGCQLAQEEKWTDALVRSTRLSIFGPGSSVRGTIVR